MSKAKQAVLDRTEAYLKSVFNHAKDRTAAFYGIKGLMMACLDDKTTERRWDTDMLCTALDAINLVGAESYSEVLQYQVLQLQAEQDRLKGKAKPKGQKVILRKAGQA